MNYIFFGKSDEITTFHFLFGFLSAWRKEKEIVELLLRRGGVRWGGGCWTISGTQLIVPSTLPISRGVQG